MRLGSCRGIVEAINEACTCGGNPPSKGCPACEVYHAIKDMDDGAAELERWKRKARKLGEYAARLRASLSQIKSYGCSLTLYDGRRGCKVYWPYNPAAWCESCVADRAVKL